MSGYLRGQNLASPAGRLTLDVLQPLGGTKCGQVPVLRRFWLELGEGSAAIRALATF